MTRNLLIQYLLSLIGYVIFLIAFALIVRSNAAQYIWQPDDFLYRVLSFIRDYILVFGAAAVLVGATVITYYFMRKPLRYLDELAVVAGELTVPTEQPIVLPVAMKEIQDELNMVREQALHNTRIAKEAEQRKNDLIVYLAHDLKTPLTSVIGYLTLLRDETQISDGLRQKYLAISLDKAERLEDLINEFFEITRFNLSQLTLEPSRINLSRMLEQLVFEFQPMLAEKKLQCNLQAAPNLTLVCDANKIQRVFDNLLRNAVNYSFVDSTVQIIVAQTENRIQIDFINRGNTIPAEKLQRIFEQFYRLDTARSTKSGGAGLGLAIARQIAELHGGSLTASSADDWIDFTLAIPAM